jgi:lysozyme
MDISPKGVLFIETSEGLKLKPYLDSGGVATIGIGCIQYEDGKRVTMKDCEISKDRALELFIKGTLPKFELAVNANVKVPLTQYEYDALVSFVYNVGVGGFKTSTLLKLLNGKKDKKEVAAQFLRWNKDNGKVVKGLTNRRTAEMNMFLGN